MSAPPPPTAAAVAAGATPVPPAPVMTTAYAATPPPLPGTPPPPPLPGAAPRPLPATGAYAYPAAARGAAPAPIPGTSAATPGALALKYGAPACFVIALIGSFLPFVTGSAGSESSSFMLWRDPWWGPVTAALIIVALVCSLIPRRATVLAAALVSIPAIILIPVRGTTYNSLEAFGLNVGFGAGWYLLMLFTLAGCALSFVALFRMRSRGPQAGWGMR